MLAPNQDQNKTKGTIWGSMSAKQQQQALKNSIQISDAKFDKNLIENESVRRAQGISSIFGKKLNSSYN